MFWQESNTIQALLSVSFHSGSVIEQPDDLTAGQLTPYHLPLTVGVSSDTKHPVIPHTGFDSATLGQMILNLHFLLHLLSRDSALYQFLGPFQSPFSRFSLLGGALMWLHDLLNDFDFSQTWNQLSPKVKRFRTELFFHLLNDLFAIWDDWESPHVPNNERFQPAISGSLTGYYFVTSVFPSNLSDVHHHLATWREHVHSHIGRASLFHQLSSMHHYASHRTPAFLLASPPPDPDRRRGSRAQAPAPAPRFNPPRASRSRTNPPPSAPPTRPDIAPSNSSPPPQPPPATCNHTPPRPDPVPGESIACQCLLKSVDGVPFRPLHHLIRTATPPLRAPSVNDSSSRLPNATKPPCFGYITEGSHGCPRPTQCQFCHLDMNSEDTHAIRHDFFRDLLRLLNHPAVATHFQPTTFLLDFCNANNIQT